jgi:hypothetical protein
MVPVPVALTGRVLAGITALVATMIVVACVAPPTPSTTASSTPTATAGVFPPSPLPYRGATRPVAGLFTEPRTTPVDATRTLPPPPPSPYGGWDGRSVVLVNLETGERIDLGPGRISPASPFDHSSRIFTWGAAPPSAANTPLSAARVEVMELATGRRTSYGEALTSMALDGHRIIETTPPRSTTPPQNVVIDIASGANLGPLSTGGQWRQHFDGAELTIEQEPFTTYPVPTDRRFTVVPDDGNAAVVFHAAYVVPDWSRTGSVFAIVRGPGDASNAFRIDVDAARATFVATIHLPDQVIEAIAQGVLPPLGNMAATGASLLVLPDRSCSPDARLLVFDSASARLTAIATALLPGWPLLGGLGLGDAPLTPRVDVAPDTLRYLHVLPASGAWSDDGKWAAFGPMLASLDLCASVGGIASGR